MHSSQVRGSSPLARGLPSATSPASLWPRIIPARAGFTSTPHPRDTRPQDHPRSRGVYPPVTWTPFVCRGSSPLARGLPGSGGRPRKCCRIIPARAGFTVSGDSRGHAGADHPRSRGVYSIRRLSVAILSGSSPLARGLPCADCPGITAPGIIPARAGFTPPRPG